MSSCIWNADCELFFINGNLSKGMTLLSVEMSLSWNEMRAINIFSQKQAAQHGGTRKTGRPGGCRLISQAETLFFLLPEDDDSWQESCLKIYPVAWNVTSALLKAAHHRSLTICAPVSRYFLLPPCHSIKIFTHALRNYLERVANAWISKAEFG